MAKLQSSIVLSLLLFPCAVVQADGPAASPSAPPVKVLEADGSKITLTTSHPALDQRLFLVSQTDKPLKVTLAVSDLRGSGGQTGRLVLDPPGPLSFGSYQAQAVTLKGIFAGVGELAGVLSLTLEGVAQPFQYALTVKREKGAQQIDLDAQAEPPVYRRLFGSGTSADVRLSLAETTGAPADYQWPELQSLLLNVSDTQKAGAHYTRVRLLDADGQELPRDNKALVAPVALPGFGLRKLLLRIEGLQGVGKYEGTVRVATPNGVQPKPFTLFLKDHWLLAALVILMGVWCSFWIRHWLQIGRPQALAEYQIGLLLQRIQIVIPDAADGVRRALENALQELHRMTLLDSTTDVKPGLQKAGEELQNYLVLRTVFDLRPQLDALLPDKTQRVAVENRLDALQQHVQDGNLSILANDDAGMNALVDEARSIRQDLLAGAGQALDKALSILKTSLDDERAALATGSLPAANQKELAARLDEAEGHLTAAKRKLADSRATTGQPAADLLQQGWQEYETGSRISLVASGERFRRELTVQTTPPLGMEPAAWQALQKEILAALPPGPTPEQYATARRTYLDAVLAALGAQAAKAASEALQSPPGGSAAAAAQLDAIAQRAAAARQTLAASGQVTISDVTKLRADYDAAMALLPAGAGPIKMAMAVGGALAAAPLPGAAPAAFPRAPELPPVRDPVLVVRDVLSHDAIVAWIVCVVSVLVGLRVLWAPVPAFGSLLDYIGAFLWGFGLHELNKLAMPDALGKLGLALPQGKLGPDSGRG